MPDLRTLPNPDPRRRLSKSVWRQAIALVGDALSAALTELSVSAPRVLVLSETVIPGRLLQGDAGRAWSVEWQPLPGSAADVRAHHAVAVVVPDGARPGERIEVLRNAVNTLRPGGALVVLANVVVPPGAQVATGGVHDLSEELILASGGCLHLDEIRSVRWADEPFRRGVVLTLTQLSTRGPAA